MKGIGIAVNILAVLVGGGFGLILRGKLKTRYQELLYRLMGLIVLGFGAYAFLEYYFSMTGGKVELKGSMLVVLALVLGGLIGYLFNLGGFLQLIGNRLALHDQKERARDKQRLDQLSGAVDLAVKKGVTLPHVPLLDRLPTYEMAPKLTEFVYTDGFYVSIVFLSANALLLNGVLDSALWGETTLLLIKSGADFLFCFTLAMICGSGVLYAVVPMAVIEALLTLLSLIFPNFVETFFSPVLTSQLSVIAAVTCLFLGIQMCFDRKRLNAAALLPAPLIPILYYGILMIVNLFVGE